MHQNFITRSNNDFGSNHRGPTDIVDNLSLKHIKLKLEWHFNMQLRIESPRTDKEHKTAEGKIQKLKF